MKNLNWGAILRSIMNKIYEKIANLRTEINFFKKKLEDKLNLYTQCCKFDKHSNKQLTIVDELRNFTHLRNLDHL